MTINLKDKQKLVKKIKKILENVSSIVIADYRGTSTNKINELRKLSHINDVYIRIIRNTLMKRVIKNTSFECLTEYINGPNMFGFSYKHPGLCVRLFKNFSDSENTFKIKVASFEGKIITPLNINYLANLPTYKEAIISFALTIKEAIIMKLINVLILLSRKNNLN